MEILKRARGNSGEVLPFGTPPAGLQDELNHRMWKAGYTDRDGQKMISKEIISGLTTEQYRENYVKIFKHN